jgi:hypothetical protein
MTAIGKTSPVKNMMIAKSNSHFSVRNQIETNGLDDDANNKDYHKS